MALVVEDGTGVADANTYVSVQDADAYFLARNRVVWASASPEMKSAGLIEAADFLEVQYGSDFIGRRVNALQSMSWPRAPYYTPSIGESWATTYTFPAGVPRNLVIAQLELAYAFVQGGGVDFYNLPTLTATVTEETDTIGPLTTTRKYALSERASGVVTATGDRLTVLLAALVHTQSGQFTAVRG